MAFGRGAYSPRRRKANGRDQSNRSFLLERGIAVRQGPRFLRQRLPEILAKGIDVLSPRMIAIIEDLSDDWRRLDERVERVTEEIEQLAHGSESCRQLMTVPGIGETTS